MNADAILSYEDFAIKVEPKHGNSYPVIVTASPAGEGRSELLLPFDPASIGKVLLTFGDVVRGIEQPASEAAPVAAASLQELGDQLFDALFTGPVLSLLDRSLGMIYNEQKGLRIKLHIDPEDPTLAALASLPWEFVYRQDTRDFLNLSRFTPLVRYLDVQRPYLPLPLQPPLRILVALAQPRGLSGLDLIRERTLIERTWAKQPGVQVDFLEHPSVLNLQDQLTDQVYHVFHYMGHGTFDEAHGQGALIFEDENGQPAPVDGVTLGILLRDVPTMRLVFLNACETARAADVTGVDPFAGVASGMVLAGVPAVVAMQFPITDTAAVQFSHRFYSLVARGFPVDTAVAEGRRSIRLADSRSLEWGTPVLFMRAPNGKIFDLPKDQEAALPPPESIEPQLDKELDVVYTGGLAALTQRDWDRAIQAFETVQKRRSGYRDVDSRLEQARFGRQQALAETGGAPATESDARPSGHIETPDRAGAAPIKLAGGAPPAGGPPATTGSGGRSKGVLFAGLAVAALAVIALAVWIGGRDHSANPPSPTVAIAVVEESATATATSILVIATPSVTGEAKATPTVAGRPFIVPSQAIKVRSGPGIEFSSAGAIGEADTTSKLGIVGKNADASWLRICCLGGDPVWVDASLVVPQGDISQVPVITVVPPTIAPEPATPTPVSLVDASTPTAPEPSTPIAVVTPTPQATPPSREVGATPTPVGCLLPVDARLATLYRQDKLGCARADASIVLSSWRPFERGVLWWRKDTGNITVLPVGNPWSMQQDLWDQVSVVPSRGAPPIGFQAPDRGFGFLWGSNDRVFDQLGWSTGDEQGFCALVQVFDTGVLMRASEAPTCEGQANKALEANFPPVYVGLYGDRTWQQGS